MKTQVFLALLWLTLFCNPGYSQLAEPARFTDKLQGQWQLTELIAGGRVVDHSHYKPTTFSKDHWTIETKKEAHSYALSSATTDKELTEVTVLDTKSKRGFVALMKLDGEDLIVARRQLPLDEQSKLKRDDGILMMAKPESIDPGQNTLVYKFRRQIDRK